MTESKKQPIADKAKKPAAKTGSELSETDLNKASGGAYDAFRSITDGTHGAGGGGGAGIAGHIWVDKKGSV
jgi:hypothetical protein